MIIVQQEQDDDMNLREDRINSPKQYYDVSAFKALSYSKQFRKNKNNNKRNLIWILVAVICVALLYWVLVMGKPVSTDHPQTVRRHPVQSSNIKSQPAQKQAKIIDLKAKQEMQTTRQQLEQAKKTITVLQEHIKTLKGQSTQTKKQSDTKTSSNTQTAASSQKLSETKYDIAKIDDPGQVIKGLYNKDRPSKLPLNFLSTNEKGQKIQEVLYANEEIRQKRIQFNDQRHEFMNRKGNFQSAFLAKYNLIVSEYYDTEAKSQNQKDWKRLQQKFQLTKVKTELQMCIMVPGYNNNDKFRIEYNLNSIFAQNYTNYKVVIVNDASTDKSGQVYRNYLSFYNIDPKYYVYVQNKKRVTALQNIYLNSIKHCGIDSIVVTLDADDQFIGRNVLNVFNWGYQTKKSGVLYTNFYWYLQPNTLNYGFTSQYSQDQKSRNSYRQSAMKFSHLRSYRNWLIHQINPKDLQDKSGQFFTIAYDMALFFPLMELSCTRVHKIEGEFHYLYNTGTGLNDYNNRGKQVQIDQEVRRQEKYTCFEEFDKMMKQLQ